MYQRDSESTFPNDILGNDNFGDLDEQTLELDADAHSAIFVLANLLERGERRGAIKLLQLEAAPAGGQDEVLYSTFVIAVGGYLFVRPPASLERRGIYTGLITIQYGNNTLLVLIRDMLEHTRPDKDHRLSAGA